jgi:hypothetical protein
MVAVAVLAIAMALEGYALRTAVREADRIGVVFLAAFPRDDGRTVWIGRARGDDDGRDTGTPRPDRGRLAGEVGVPGRKASDRGVDDDPFPPGVGPRASGLSSESTSGPSAPAGATHAGVSEPPSNRVLRNGSDGDHSPGP